MASSSLRPRRITVFVYGASAPPLFGAPLRASGFMCGYLCIGYVDSYVHHGYPMHGILDHGYSPSSSATSTSAQRATIYLSNLVGFHSSHSICDALTVVTAGGCQLFDFSPVSPYATLPL